MKNLLIKSRKSLAVITGIIFFGVILTTITEKIPVTYVEANQYENSIGTLSTSTTTVVEEKIFTRDLPVNHVPTYVPDKTKVENVRRYLAGRNAPLADYAEEFVKAADHYNIDYRIIAAISVIESGGGKHNFRPYNAWGWGKMTFSSWEEGIWTVSKGIGGYYSRGLTTPKLISTYYCPPNAVKWASNVQLVMNQIGN